MPTRDDCESAPRKRARACVRTPSACFVACTNTQPRRPRGLASAPEQKTTKARARLVPLRRSTPAYRNCSRMARAAISMCNPTTSAGTSYAVRERPPLRSRAPPTPAEQIEGLPELEQRIVAGLDPVDARDWVEDDRFLRLRVVRRHRGERDPAERNEWPVLGHRTVASSTTSPSRAVCTTTWKPIDPASVRRASSSKRKFAPFAEACVAQAFDARIGDEPVPSVTAHAVLVDEAHGCHSEIRLPREARRGRLRLQERPCRGSIADEGVDGRRGRLGRGGGCQRTQELDELLPRAHGKAVLRVGDDVGMNVLGQLEANGHAAGVRVGSSRSDPNARGVREAGDHGGGRPVGVRRARQGRGLA